MQRTMHYHSHYQCTSMCTLNPTNQLVSHLWVFTELDRVNIKKYPSPLKFRLAVNRPTNARYYITSLAEIILVLVVVVVVVVVVVIITMIIIVAIAGNHMSARANTTVSHSTAAPSWDYPRPWIQSLGKTSAAAHGADARAAWRGEHEPAGVHKTLETGTACTTCCRAEAGAEKCQSK